MGHLNRLTVRQVEKVKTPGRHADGGNLYVKVTKLPSSALAASYVFMFKHRGKQREAGLGSRSAVTLAQARDKAAEYRLMLAKGIDPLAERMAAREACAKRKTFGECADEFLESKRREWRPGGRQATLWRTTVNGYCEPILGKQVDTIDTQAVLSVLQPLWGRIPETASRLRGRIEAILDYARAHGFRTGENPAVWRGHLALILPKRQKLSRGHHVAMPYAEIPALVGKLREAESIPAMALEFLILTAARSGEALGARWDEIDLDTKTWNLPPERMKAGRAHCVPLSGRALAIIERMAELRSGDFVFPGQRRGRPLSDRTVSPLVPGATIHGLRSSFRDWAGNETSFPREVAEQALAHVAGNSTEQAYRRGDALEKRRVLMEAWASYCEPHAPSNVVSISRAS